MAGDRHAVGIDAVAEAGPHVPLDEQARVRERLAAGVQRLDRDQVRRQRSVT
jgi:hypothetical protein